MPNTKQMETLARGQARMTGSLTAPPPDQLPSEWQSVLADPRAGGKPWVRIEQRRLSEVPREVLRVECLRCFRLVEIRKAVVARTRFGKMSPNVCSITVAGSGRGVTSRMAVGRTS
jgi:hypothetical protein